MIIHRLIEKVNSKIAGLLQALQSEAFFSLLQLPGSPDSQME